MAGVELMEYHRPHAARSGGFPGVGALYGAERRGHGEYLLDILPSDDADGAHFSSSVSFHAKYSLTAFSPFTSASLP